MPFDPISWLIIGAVAAGFAVAFWDNIREKVSAWLRNRGLSHSALMDAWIKLDSVMGRIRCRIFVKTREHGVQETSETTYESIDDIEDPDVQKALRANGYAEKNIMSHVH